MTSISPSPAVKMPSAIGRSPPGGISIAGMCGTEAGRMLLVSLHVSKLRIGNAHEIRNIERSCLRHDRASLNSSASLRGINSTEILIEVLSDDTLATARAALRT